MINVERLDQRYNPYFILEHLRPRYDAVYGKYADYEYERKHKQIDYFMEKIKQGQVDYITLVGNGDSPNSLDFLRYFYDALSAVDRYRVTVDTYSGNGYNFPKDLIIGLKKCKPLDYLENLPTEYTKVESITVYRASQTPPDGKLENEISWTTCRGVAEWFLERYDRNNTVAYLYSGDICKQDIIAFTNDREECEIIQHGDVRNIRLLEEL